MEEWIWLLKSCYSVGLTIVKKESKCENTKEINCTAKLGPIGSEYITPPRE
jgi:hypothetical protein